MDLTKIEKPFGLLDAETRAALRKYFDAGGKVEFYSVHGWLTAVSLAPESYTYRARAYRVAPPPDIADELADALRALLHHRDGDGAFAAARFLTVTALLARYDAQK